MTTRRSFIQKFTAPLLAVPFVNAATECRASDSNDKVLRVAIMGLGGYGNRVAEAMMATRRTLSLLSAALHSVAAFTNGTASNGAVNFCMKERRVVMLKCLLAECKHFKPHLQGEAGGERREARGGRQRWA